MEDVNFSLRLRRAGRVVVLNRRWLHRRAGISHAVADDSFECHVAAAFPASVFRPADCTPGITVKAHPDKSPARTLLASRRSLFPPSLNSGVGLMTRPSSTRSRYETRGVAFRKMAGALGSVSPARASGKGGDPARALAGFAAGLRTSNQISGRHMTHCGFTLGASYYSFIARTAICRRTRTKCRYRRSCR